MSRFSLYVCIPLFACEPSTEKDPEGPADYNCTLTITGTDDAGINQTLIESTSELSCVSSAEKTEFMDESCSLDMSNYSEYSDVNCDWSCSVLGTCAEEN